MTTDKKTAEEILTMNGIWNYADNIKISRKDLIELMEKYAYQFKNNTNIDIEDEIRYGNENTAPYHNFNTTPAPIQEGEVDKYPNGRCQKEEEGQDRCGKRCDHCIKYYYPLDSQDISQAKQGKYSEKDMRTFAYKTWHKSDTISNGYEYQLWENSYIEYLLQAHPDHIPDSGKLVKTMSVELPGDDEITKEGMRFEGCIDRYFEGLHYNSDWTEGAKWLRDKIKSQLSTDTTPLTIEEAKDKIAEQEGYGDWSDLMGAKISGVTGAKLFAIVNKYTNKAMQLYAQSQQPK